MSEYHIFPKIRPNRNISPSMIFRMTPPEHEPECVFEAKINIIPGLMFGEHGICDDMYLRECLLCASWCSLLLLVYLFLLFFSLCKWFKFPLCRHVLGDLNTIFLKGERQPSMPICFRIYVFSFMAVVLWLLLGFYGINIFYYSIFKSEFCSWNWNDHTVLNGSLLGL